MYIYIYIYVYVYGHECEQTLGDGERLGSLVSFSPWAHKESDLT